MRTRTKMGGLAYHAKPSGNAHLSSKAKCEVILQRCQRLIDEGYKLTEAKKESDKQLKAVVTTVFGNEVKVSIDVFKAKYEPYGFKVIMEIYG